MRWLLPIIIVVVIVPTTEYIIYESSDTSSILVIAIITFLVVVSFLIDIYIFILSLHLCHNGLLHGNHLLLGHPFQVTLLKHLRMILLLHHHWIPRLLELVYHLLNLVCLLLLLVMLLLLLLLLLTQQQLIGVDSGDVVGEVGLAEAFVAAQVAEGDTRQ